MNKRVPEGVVISRHLYLEADALIKKMKKTRKFAIKSYEQFYEKRIKDWIEEGKDVDIRAEQKNMRQTSRNIARAIDAIIDSVESTKEQA